MRTFPGGECPPEWFRYWRIDGSRKIGDAGGSKQATAKIGEGPEAFLTGSGTAAGAGTDASRLQHALGALRVWHENRIARQHADSVAMPVGQAWAILNGTATIDARRKRQSADFRSTEFRNLERLQFMLSSDSQTVPRLLVPVNEWRFATRPIAVGRTLTQARVQ